MGGNWSGCCVVDMALRLMVMVEVPEGVTRGGGEDSAACQTPDVERAGEDRAILVDDRQKQNKDQWQKHANPCWRTEPPGQ